MNAARHHAEWLSLVESSEESGSGDEKEKMTRSEAGEFVIFSPAPVSLKTVSQFRLALSKLSDALANIRKSPQII